MRKPRGFNHQYIYVDERKEKLAKMEEKARRDLGMLPEKEFNPESIADKLFHSFKKKKVNISWFFLNSRKMPSDKKLKRMAEKSYKEFRVG